MKLKQFFRQETVLCVAAVLAVCSAFVVHPDAQYIDYIDFRTLAILFSLMTVMAGLRRQSVFDRLGHTLLAHSGGTLQLVLVLVGLCFFGSMFITNDVSLLTFVPFTFAVLVRLDDDSRKALALPIVCMQTVAANLGGMLTPIGNPQNLYLFSKSGISLSEFLALMLPYTLISAVLLFLWAWLVCRRKCNLVTAALSSEEKVTAPNTKIVVMYVLLFVFCLLTVARIVPYPVAFATVLICVLAADRKTLSNVDYSLLLTFVAFFVFIGNLGRVPAFSGWLGSVIAGWEVPVAVLASQVTSNVPTALLLSGFTTNIKALIIGTNLGGLGTLIASMASLISYRQITRELPQEKGSYFAMFTASNLFFLAVLMGLWAIL